MHTVLQTNPLKSWRIMHKIPQTNPSRSWRISFAVLRRFEGSHAKDHNVWRITCNTSNDRRTTFNPSRLWRFCLKFRMRNPSSLRRIVCNNYSNLRKISLKDCVCNHSTHVWSFKLILRRFEESHAILQRVEESRIVRQTNPLKDWRITCSTSKGWGIEHDPSNILRH